MEYYINIFSALLTPIIGIVVAYIAVQQHKITKYKYKHDLFERRIAIYKSVIEFVSNIRYKLPKGDDVLIKFARDTADAYLLFNTDIIKYIETLQQKGYELFCIHDEFSDKSTGESKYPDLVKQRKELLNYFRGQHNKIKEVFYKPLSLDI